MPDASPSSVGLEQSGRRQSGDNDRSVVVPVVEEMPLVEKREVETGRVRITKRVTEHEETVDEPLLREEVSVERFSIDTIIEGPAPSPRQEGETTIIPVVEEVLVVERRLRLKEEIHITRRRLTVHQPAQVTLRREEVVIEHEDLAHPSDGIGA